MGRKPCCPKEGLNRGAWTAMEDDILVSYIGKHGEGRWGSLPKRAGLKRCGKSCRLRWLNYLRPGIKRGNISGDEEELIIRLHRLLGNRWSLIAGRLPGRTDNEIKNYWNTTLGKKVRGEAPSRHSTKQHHASAAVSVVVHRLSPEPASAAAPGATVPLSSPRPNNASPIRTKALRCPARLLVAPAASHDGCPPDHGEATAEVRQECCLPDDDLSMPIDIDLDLSFLSPWRGEACGEAGGDGHQHQLVGAGEGDVEALLMGEDVEFTWF